MVLLMRGPENYEHENNFCSIFSGYCGSIMSKTKVVFNNEDS